MRSSYNLLYEPWIPCYTTQGERTELGILSLLENSHDLDRIEHPTPIVTASLYRLVLAFLHAAIRGPKTFDQWKDLYQNNKFSSETFIDYLDQKIVQSFDLLNPKHPFYQSNIEYKTPTTIQKLVMHFADAGGAVMFNHQGYFPYEVSLAESACLLISYQYNWFGGTIAALPPQKGPVSHTEAPARKGITYLIRGENLFQTLMFNLVIFNDEKPFVTYDDDEPAWEKQDPFEENGLPNGFLDLLTWQNLRMKLFLSENENIANVGLVAGRRLDTESLQNLDIRDPYHSYAYNKTQAYSAVKFEANRILWRDSSALFMTFQDNNAKVRAPYNVACMKDHLSNGDVELSGMMNIMCFGVRSGSNAGLIIFYKFENFAFPAKLLINSDKYYPYINKALQFIEQLNNILEETSRCLLVGSCKPGFATEALSLLSEKNGLKSFYKFLSQTEKVLDKDIIKKRFKTSLGEAYFWSMAELEFHNFLDLLIEDENFAFDQWAKRIQNILAKAFDKNVDAICTGGVNFTSYVLANKIKNIKMSMIFSKGEDYE